LNFSQQIILKNCWVCNIASIPLAYVASPVHPTVKNPFQFVARNPRRNHI
jgi:hypothetical protein